MLGVTGAETQAVRTFIVGAVCPKMSKAMALKTGFPVAEVVRLQWGESELAVQGPLCADLIYQLCPLQCSFGLLGEKGWRWVRSGSSWGNRNLPEFSEIVINISDQLRHF